jgi:hypothetical protein
VLKKARVPNPFLNVARSVVSVFADRDTKILEVTDTDPVDNTEVDKDAKAVFVAVIAVVDTCVVDSPLVIWLVPVIMSETIVAIVLRPPVRKSAALNTPVDSVPIVIASAVVAPTYALPEDSSFTVKLLVYAVPLEIAPDEI